MTPDEAVLIPIIGMMIPMVVVPTVLLVRYLRLRREMLHRERMRALELGQPAPGTNTWPAAVAALGIRPVVTDTVMSTPARARRLAATVLRALDGAAP